MKPYLDNQCRRVWKRQSFLVKLYKRRAQENHVFYGRHRWPPSISPILWTFMSESNNQVANYDENENVVRTVIEVMGADDKQREIKGIREWKRVKLQEAIVSCGFNNSFLFVNRSMLTDVIWLSELYSLSHSFRKYTFKLQK